jgi:hypothetical protein
MDFSIANLYNSASSNAVIPIKIHPIMISIIFHHYKMITKKLFTRSIGDIKNSDDENYDDDIDDDNNNDNINFIILDQELDRWKNFSFVLRKQNRILFEEMLQSSYKYSDAINAKGKEYSTESLFMALIFDQQKK